MTRFGIVPRPLNFFCKSVQDCNIRYAPLSEVSQPNKVGQVTNRREDTQNWNIGSEMGGKIQRWGPENVQASLLEGSEFGRGSTCEYGQFKLAPTFIGASRHELPGELVSRISQ